MFTSKAPEPTGPFSQAIRVGQTVYLSGQIGINPATGTMVEGTFEDEAVQAFNNLKAVAEAAGVHWMIS